MQLPHVKSMGFCFKKGSKISEISKVASFHNNGYPPALCEIMLTLWEHAKPMGDRVNSMGQC